MITSEVASDELRDVVSRLASGGLPTAVSLKGAEGGLTTEQQTILIELSQLSEQEEALVQEGQRPTEGDEWWQTRMAIRSKLQQAVLAGVLPIGLIQRQAIAYGAIPDPEKKWSYFCLPDGSYACWRCGSEILAKEQSVSVHIAGFFGGMAGSGEVRSNEIPYCPNCDEEPPDRGIVYETLDQSLARARR